MEKVPNRKKLESIEKDDDESNIKQQSKQAFNRIHKSCILYDSSKFKQNEVILDKPVYVGIVVVGMSKLLMYETLFDKL